MYQMHGNVFGHQTFFLLLLLLMMYQREREKRNLASAKRFFGLSNNVFLDWLTISSFRLFEAQMNGRTIARHSTALCPSPFDYLDGLWKEKMINDAHDTVTTTCFFRNRQKIERDFFNHALQGTHTAQQQTQTLIIYAKPTQTFP